MSSLVFFTALQHILAALSYYRLLHAQQYSTDSVVQFMQLHVCLNYMASLTLLTLLLLPLHLHAYTCCYCYVHARVLVLILLGLLTHTHVHMLLCKLNAHRKQWLRWRANWT
jgi:hypothetical protein